jgi:hypothetical protein
MNTSGFYKKDNDSLLFAPNWVQSKEYTLTRNDKDKYNYPVDGWTWFDDAASAYKANDLIVPADGDIAIQSQIASTVDWDGFKGHLDTSGIYQQMLEADFSLATDAFQAISFILGGIEVDDNIRQLNIFYGVLQQKAQPELTAALDDAIDRFNIPINRAPR